jgi:hypothetical protein
VPLKDKRANSITTALKYLFQDRIPIIIQSDKGTEFVNAIVQQYLKRQGVSFHTTHDPDKSFYCQKVSEIPKDEDV